MKHGMAQRLASWSRPLLLTGLQHFLVRLVQIHQHDHTNLHGNAGQRNEAYTDRNRKVIAQQIHQPDCANHGKRQRTHDDAHFRKTAEVQEQQNDDNRQRQRHHVGELFLGTQHVLILARPGNRIARRQVKFLVHGGHGLLHISADIDPFNIHEGPAIEAGVFTFDGGRTVFNPNIGDVGQRNPLPR